MTPKPDDAKPDALQSLRDLVEDFGGDVPYRVTAAITAWEKERAERDSVPTLVLLRQRTNELGKLRAAVEKVRDEVRVRLAETIKTGDIPVHRTVLERWNDALDAALRGD